MTLNNITLAYHPPLLHDPLTMLPYKDASTTTEVTMYERIATKAKTAMDYTDKILAVLFIGIMLAVTPLYCSASIIKAHVKPVEKPMLSAMSIKVLTKAVGRVAQVQLVPTQDRLPTVRGR